MLTQYGACVMRFEDGHLWFKTGKGKEIGIPLFEGVGGFWLPVALFAAGVAVPYIIRLFRAKPAPQAPQQGLFDRILNAAPWFVGAGALSYAGKYLPKNFQRWAHLGAAAVAGIGALKMLQTAPERAPSIPKAGTKPEDRTPATETEASLAEQRKESLMDNVHIASVKYYLNKYYGVIWQYWVITIEVQIVNNADVALPFATLRIADIESAITLVEHNIRNLPPHTTRIIRKEITWSEWASGIEVEWQDYLIYRATLQLPDGTVLDTKEGKLKPIKRS